MLHPFVFQTSISSNLGATFNFVPNISNDRDLTTCLDNLYQCFAIFKAKKLWIFPHV